MSGDIGAAADVVTGALAAWSIEPGADETSLPRLDRGLCLNCGTRLIGAHCHACGQSAHVHRTIGGLGHELAHGVFHFEGKIWRTLPMLAFHPGALTRRYVQGERARFVSPLALFLFTVFLMFAVISTIGGELGDGLFGGGSLVARAEMNTQLADARRDLAAKEATRESAVRSGKDHRRLDTDITALQTTIGTLRYAAAAPVDAGVQSPSIGAIHTGWARLDHGIAKAAANPGLALYKLQSSAYKYSWLLILLSTPFVALLFLWRRGHTLYDHAIFVTYSITFMMLLAIALTLLGTIGLAGAWISFAILLIPPVHMFVQLRGAYSLGRASALWRTAALLVFAFTALGAYVALLLVHGLAE